MTEFKVKSAEELAAMDSRALADYMQTKLTHDREQLEALVKGKAGADEIAALKAEIAETHNKRIDEVIEVQKQIGLAVQRLMQKADNAPAPADTVRALLEKNRDTLKAMKGGARQGFHLPSMADFHVKDPGNMSLAGNIVGGAQIPQALRLPGYNDLPQRVVRFLSLLQGGGIDSNIVEWVYMTNPDGTTGQTAEGAAKNQIDFDWALGSQRVEKTTNFIKVTTEMLDDISFMETAIRTELLRKLLQAVEVQAYSGNGTSPNMNGVNTVASAFSATGFAGTVDNANEIDVLNVALNQIALAQEGSASPNAILMHPSDLTRLKMVKVDATDRRYVDYLAMIGTESNLGGVPIITTTLVGIGTYLVGDFTKAHLLQKQAPTVQVGLDSDDFTKNFRTLLAEWRGVTYVMHNDRSAFVKGTFATDKAALETT